MEQYYKIAGLITKMDTFGRAAEQAEKYLTSYPGYFHVDIHSQKECLLEKYPKTPEDVAEYLGTAISFYRQLINFDGVMFHASAVVVDGKAYLFTADSGTGKSTHTKLWLEKFGQRAYILNDDKPAVRREADGWFAYGTPWSGKHDISVDARVPVAGVALLERAEENTIERISGIRAIQGILKQINRPRAAEYRVKLLGLLDQFITEVPVWKLCCNQNIEAATVSYEAMSRGEKYYED